MKARRAKEQRTCSIEGCARPHVAKGVCKYHYHAERRRLQAPAVDRPSRFVVGGLACAICGYNRRRSEVHRLIPKGAYVVGNMVPLCANCHREVTEGITPSPPAWQPV